MFDRRLIDYSPEYKDVRDVIAEMRRDSIRFLERVRPGRARHGTFTRCPYCGGTDVERVGCHCKCRVCGYEEGCGD